ncbi:MAG: preprotein translocase subunit YajC [Christensenellales bacterium]|jgi:preprotein translocase subunit YajC
MPESASNFFTNGTFLFLIAIVAMFLVMIIPQRKREKKIKAMLDGIKEGDRIRTIGGFYGRVINVKEDIITFECGPDKVKLSLAKNAVATVDSADVENDGGVKA